MNLNLNQIRSFLLVAEEGNLTRAADRRHTTPSAVSTHLQQLEERLGVELFARTRRGMTLTEAGERLLEPARRVMTAARELGDAAARLNGEESIRALVRTGMGVGLLEERYALEAAGDGRLKVLEQSWTIDLSLVHRADRADDPVIGALREAVETAWREPERSAA